MHARTPPSRKVGSPADCQLRPRISIDDDDDGDDDNDDGGDGQKKSRSSCTAGAY